MDCIWLRLAPFAHRAC